MKKKKCIGIMQIRVEGLSVASEPGTKSLILSPSVH